MQALNLHRTYTAWRLQRCRIERKRRQAEYPERLGMVLLWGSIGGSATHLMSALIKYKQKNTSLKSAQQQHVFPKLV